MEDMIKKSVAAVVLSVLFVSVAYFLTNGHPAFGWTLSAFFAALYVVAEYENIYT